MKFTSSKTVGSGWKTIFVPVFSAEATGFSSSRGSPRRIGLPINRAFPADFQLQSVAEGVDHRSPHPVQSAGNLVVGSVELPAGVQRGHHQLGRRNARFVVDSHRNPPAVVPSPKSCCRKGFSPRSSRKTRPATRPRCYRRSRTPNGGAPWNPRLRCTFRGVAGPPPNPPVVRWRWRRNLRGGGLLNLWT